MVVDDPGKAGVGQVLLVGEGSQHVDMPDPVHVKRRQELQVRMGTRTVVFYQGNPTLLIPSDSL